MTAQSARPFGGGLPAEVTSFVGRRHEIAEAKRLLSVSRVVTLTGPGGVGKTRLALRVAAEVRRTFRDGVWLVELADLRDVSLLANTVAERLGLRDKSARPSVLTLVEHLDTQEVLIVLDNCEHLFDGCAVFVDTVVRACPHVRVLATSRQSLGLAAESTLSVSPLPVPDVEVVSPEAGITHTSTRYGCSSTAPPLQCQVSRWTRSTTLARLCRRLDGIPLALELAAVRMRALSPEQIEERLAERCRLLTQGKPERPGAAADAAISDGLELRVVLRPGTAAVGPDFGVLRRVRVGGCSRSAAVTDFPPTRCSISSTRSSTSRSSCGRRATARCATACWRRSVSTALSGSPRPMTANGCAAGTGTGMRASRKGSRPSGSGRTRWRGSPGCATTTPTSGWPSTAASRSRTRR